jgi:hypothetical protein
MRARSARSTAGPAQRASPRLNSEGHQGERGSPRTRSRQAEYRGTESLLRNTGGALKPESVSTKQERIAKLAAESPAMACARLFSELSERCRLKIMRHRLARSILVTLLTVQLGFGLQAHVAYAAAPAPAGSLSESHSEHCPTHSSADATSSQVLGTVVNHASGERLHHHRHDCCGSLGCQCFGAQDALTRGLPSVTAMCATLRLNPSLVAPHPLVRATEFFRPPIA